MCHVCMSVVWCENCKKQVFPPKDKFCNFLCHSQNEFEVPANLPILTPAGLPKYPFEGHFPHFPVKIVNVATLFQNWGLRLLQSQLILNHVTLKDRFRALFLGIFD